MTRAYDRFEPLGLPHGFTVLVQPLVLLLVYACYCHRVSPLFMRTCPDSSLLSPEIGFNL